MFNWLTKKRISRKTFILWEVIPSILVLLLIFLLAFLNLADEIFNLLMVFLVIIFLIGHFILIQLRNNDIAPELKGKLWKSGYGIILGGWSSYLASSNKKPESSFNSAKEIYFSDDKKLRVNLFLKNILLYILLFIVSIVIYFVVKYF